MRPSMLYPLRFEPVFRHYLWGGRRLVELLNKRPGSEQDVAESWEICDHGQDQSRVAEGPLAGLTLHEVLQSHGPELLGRHHPQRQFPLLLKFLDCRRTLSVQVHPNDDQAARLDPPDLGKTEAWIVLHAEPGSQIYAGLKPGINREALASHLQAGTVEEALHAFVPRPGDCVFIPAGVVHALGSGLLIAEIQQASDTTFRLFDWNRVGPDGQPRPLHLEQALEVIDFAPGPIGSQVPRVVPPADSNLRVERLVQCDKFILERWQIAGPAQLAPADHCRVLSVLRGGLQFVGGHDAGPWQTGHSGLLPASLPGRELQPTQLPCELLCAYLP